MHKLELPEGYREDINHYLANSKLPAAFMTGFSLKEEQQFNFNFNYSDTGDDIFRIASMTKMITSIAALQLVERGKVSLDQRLNELIPEMAEIPIIKPDGTTYKSNSSITLRQLLTHTAGFCYPFTSEQIFKVYQEGRPDLTIEEWFTLPRLFEPGQQFLYGINTDWVGKLVEKLSSLSLENYFRENITGPLSMDHTWFNLPENIVSELVPFYEKTTNSDYEKIDMPHSQESFCSGGGGLNSSPNDYCKLLKCILNGGEIDKVRILAEPTIKELMFSNHLPIGITQQFEIFDQPTVAINSQFLTENNNWSLAFALETGTQKYNRSPGTGLWAGAFNTYFTIDYNKKVAIAFFSQYAPFGEDDAYNLYRLFESQMFSYFS